MNPFFDQQFESIYQESPLTVLDVGARGGIHGRWRSCEKHLNAIGFEPDVDAYESLSDENSTGGNTRYLNIALSNVHEETDFHNTRRPGCSSLLKPNVEFLSDFPAVDRFDVLSSTKVTVSTLDKVLVDAGLNDPDFIKVDTQGTALFVLQGGAETLRNSIFGVEVEAEFAEIYQGQPLFAEVDQFLRESGFALFDIWSFHWKRKAALESGGRKGQMIFADALYFKNPKELLENGNCTKSKLLKALTICSVYGYLDYAVSLTEEAMTLGILSASEHELLSKRLKKPRHLSTKWPQFRGRDKIAQIIFSIHDIFRSNDWGHSGSSGRYLGNNGDPLIRG